VDLPSYAANRLGFRDVLRTSDGQQVIMGRPDANVPLQPIEHSHTPDGKWILRGAGTAEKRPYVDQLMFNRAADGSWSYQNDRSHPDDRGSAADFARTRLQLNLQEFRADLRRFAIEQSLDRTASIQTNPHELNLRGIYVDTLAAPCFRNGLRQDDAGRLVYGQQDLKGVCGLRRMPLNDAIPGLHAQLEGSRGVWMSEPRPGSEPINQIVFVDTPLTALAYHQVNPSDRVRYIATGPLELVNAVDRAALSDERKAEALKFMLSAEQKATIEAAISAARRVGPVELVAACGRGSEGKSYTSALAAELFPKPSRADSIQAQPPAFGRDWSENVQKREREYIRSQGGQTRSVESLSL
jgi:hypothetical protein